MVAHLTRLLGPSRLDLAEEMVAAILILYGQLFALNPSPVVALNRAVSIAKVRGPEKAPAAIDPLGGDAKLDSYYLFLALRGRLLLDLGLRAEAADCYLAALDRRRSEPKRRFLRRHLGKCVSVYPA